MSKSNSPDHQNHAPDQGKLVRLHKVLADAGVASRRASEELILDGRVSVDGMQILELGYKINPEISEVIEKLRKLKIKARKPGFVEYFNGIKEQLLLAARAIKKPLTTKRNSDKAQCVNRVVIHS